MQEIQGCVKGPSFRSSIKMVEKKHIVVDLMLKYDGPASIEDFYGEVEKWMQERNLHKDLKRKSENVTSKGKKIEWIIEAWRSPVRAVKQMVRLRALFNNVKEVKIKRKNHTIRINKVNALITIDGWMETSLTSRWTAINPLYAFFRTLYDKYIWLIGSNVTEANEGPVTEDCYDLHKRLKAFFELYKMKVR